MFYIGDLPMSEATLYLIQSHFGSTEHTLNQLDQIYSPSDAIVLMGDSALYAQSDLLKDKNPIFILENDAEVLAHQMLDAIQIIDYPKFAEIVLSFNRCISLK